VLGPLRTHAEGATPSRRFIISAAFQPSASHSGPPTSRQLTVQSTRELMPNPAQCTAAFPRREGEMYQIAESGLRCPLWAIQIRRINKNNRLNRAQRRPVIRRNLLRRQSRRQAKRNSQRDKRETKSAVRPGENRLLSIQGRIPSRLIAARPSRLFE